MFPNMHLNVNTMSAALGILTAMITPALLLSACGSFILSTSNRLARVVDRMRLLATQSEELAGKEDAQFKQERLRLWRVQIETQSRRLRHLQKAQTLLFLAASLIVCASLSLGLVTAVSLTLYWIPVALGLTGASLFLVATIFLLLETQIAVSTVYDETSLLLNIADHHVEQASLKKIS